MHRRQVQTVRSPKVQPTRQTTAEQVFGFATVPRNFMGDGRGRNQNFLSSPNGILIAYSPSDLHSSSQEGSRQISRTFGSSNNVSTLRNGMAPSPMVVDGLVLNRFSRSGGSGKNTTGYGSVGNNVGTVHNQPANRYSEDGGDYSYSTENSDTYGNNVSTRQAQTDHSSTLRRIPKNHQDSTWQQPPPPPPPLPSPPPFREDFYEPVPSHNSSYSSFRNSEVSNQRVSETNKFHSSIRSKAPKDKQKNKFFTVTKEESGKSVNFRRSRHEVWDPNSELEYNQQDRNTRVHSGNWTNNSENKNPWNYDYKSSAPLGTSPHSSEYAEPIINSHISKPLPPIPSRHVKSLNIDEKPRGDDYGSRYKNNIGSTTKLSSIPNQSSSKAAHSFEKVTQPPPQTPKGAGVPPPPPPPPATRGIPDVTRLGGNNAGQGKNAPAVADGRSQLMAAIQKGVQLKKVEAQPSWGRKGFRK